MIIGNFNHDTKRDTYTGEVRTLTLLRGKVQFRPVNKSSEKEPDFRIVEEGEYGIVELGAAWKRTSKSGNDFLSVVLDDPALPRTLRAALMPAEDGSGAILIWSRPTRKAEAE